MFERMNMLVREQLAEQMALESYRPEPIQPGGLLIEQRFSASGYGGPTHVHGRVRVLEEEALGKPRFGASGVGRHAIGFDTATDLLIACSLLCVEPDISNARVCEKVIESFEPRGDLGPEPSSTVLSRLVAGFADRPMALVGVLVGLGVLVAGVAATLRGLLLMRRRAR